MNQNTGNNYGGSKNMDKRIKSLAAVVLFWLVLFPFHIKGQINNTRIARLTFSGNNKALYPSLNHDGDRMLYVLDIKENDSISRAIIFKNLETGEERELYRDRNLTAQAPFDNIPLLVGSKPPVLSGDGRTAVFTLSLDKPGHILDHYLAKVDTSGKNLRITAFPINALEGKDIENLGFTCSDWERISSYAVSSTGDHIACVLKGHLGPRRFGNPSGIILLDSTTDSQKTILAPDFDQEMWAWSSFPNRPLTGGGWAFALSGDGKWLVFGAQNSEDKTDYDLYIIEWDGQEMRRVTDFHDRWFSMADISYDGQVIVFYYAGKKQQGIGTYVIDVANASVKHLESKTTPRIEFIDMSDEGRYVLFKRVYTGMMYDLFTNEEKVIYSENTPGYVSGIFPMDFPASPAFWRPSIISFSGDKVLLTGPPKGRQSPEVYLLNIEAKAQD